MLRQPKGRMQQRQCMQIYPLNQNTAQIPFILLESRFSPGEEHSSFQGEISVEIHYSKSRTFELPRWRRRKRSSNPPLYRDTEESFSPLIKCNKLCVQFMIKGWEVNTRFKEGIIYPKVSSLVGKSPKLENQKEKKFLTDSNPMKRIRV